MLVGAGDTPIHLELYVRFTVSHVNLQAMLFEESSHSEVTANAHKGATRNIHRWNCGGARVTLLQIEPSFMYDTICGRVHALITCGVQ